jgi:hypothetical protein
MASPHNTIELDTRNLPDCTPAHFLVAPEGEKPPSLYSSPVFHGYSLWLCPSAGVDETFLSEVIADTASSLNTDSFPPHLTVVAAMNDFTEEELLAKMVMYEKRLSHNFDDIFVPQMNLRAMGSGELFFQSVYVHPKMTTSIAAVNRVACEIFNREGNGCGYDGAYMPHLSMVYGS